MFAQSCSIVPSLSILSNPFSTLPPPPLTHPPHTLPARPHLPTHQPAALSLLAWGQGAIKTRVEENQQRSKVAELEAQGNTQRAAALRRRLDAPPDTELQNDMTALAAELERCYHHLKRMPTRAELRSDHRQVLQSMLLLFYALCIMHAGPMRLPMHHACCFCCIFPVVLLHTCLL